MPGRHEHLGRACAVGGEASHAVPAEIALSIAAGALSVVAGFASFIPGGLVVRDAVLLELLAPAVGKGPALVYPAGHPIGLATVGSGDFDYPISRGQEAAGREA